MESDLVVSADAGELNDVTIAYRRGVYTVRDDGAPVTPGEGCRRTDAHRARCRSAEGPLGSPSIYLKDGDDKVTVLGATGSWIYASGDAGDDVIDISAIGRRIQSSIDGRAGNDRIVGGIGSDSLSGGGGVDNLSGGPGRDYLTDDDDYGHRLERNPLDDDWLDGGRGRDSVSYRNRREELDIDLADPGPDGQPGENDTLVSVENVDGGSGPNTLVGDRGPNTLEGGGGDDYLAGSAGDDVLDGGGGLDRLEAGPGNDTIHGPYQLADGAQASCGSGRDELVEPAVGYEPGSACELVRYYGPITTPVSVTTRPVRVGPAARFASFRASCPGSARVGLFLRRGGALLGHSSVVCRSRPALVAVELTRGGRRIARNRRPVKIGVTVRISERIDSTLRGRPRLFVTRGLHAE